MSSDESCIFYKFHKKVNEVKAKLNLNFTEASQFVLEFYSSDIVPILGPQYQLLYKSVYSNNNKSDNINNSQSSQLSSNKELTPDSLQSGTTLVHKFSTKLIKYIETLSDPKIASNLIKQVTTINNQILQEDNICMET